MTVQNVPDRIMQAAAKCFLESDYKKVTTREIAARAETSVAMISYYFGSKSKLFEAVIKQYFSEIYGRLDVSGEHVSLEEGLEASWDIYYRVMIEKPELPRLMVRALVYGDVPGHDYLVENVLGKKMDGFVNRLKDGQRNGHVRNDVSVKHVWLMCASVAMMPVLYRSIVGKLFDKDESDELKELAIMASSVIARGLEPGK